MATDMQVDVIVVGSGPSAVNAAYPLVEAGLAVRILDVGNRDATYASAISEAPFSDLRRNDPQQHRYFLGEDFEGIGFDHVGSGAQVTPPRQYVCKDAQRLQPIVFDLSPTAEPRRGRPWGCLGCGSPSFTTADLAGFQISYADLVPHYEAVAARIGVSGACDDLLPFLGRLSAMQPPLENDSNSTSIMSRYSRNALELTVMAFIWAIRVWRYSSRPHRGRDANRYWDMDFWTDAGKSVYRPRWTIDELRGCPNFSFIGQRFVRTFEETAESVIVHALDLASGCMEQHRGRALVLAAGALGTTRIVLRSLKQFGRRVPIVCNPHTYMALVNLNGFGRASRDRAIAWLSFVLCTHQTATHDRSPSGIFTPIALFSCSGS